jgi:hypothetical protein
MAIKNLPLVIFIFLPLVFAGAQEAGYFIDYSSRPPRFYQRFVWDREEYAMQYEVIIQVDNNGYRDYLRRITDETFIVETIPPGIYRYAVIPYDLLGIPGEQSLWYEFIVNPANIPVVTGFYPPSFYIDQKTEKSLLLTGDNFTQNSLIYLKGPDYIYPVEIEILSKKRVRLRFDDKVLYPGRYEIIVVNPGNFEYTARGFEIKNNRQINLFVSPLLTWTPVIPVYGVLKDVYRDNNDTASFLGASLNFDLVSAGRSFFNGGMGLSVSGYLYNFYLNEKSGEFMVFDVSAAVSDINLYVVLQKDFYYRRMIAALRFGVGLTLFYDGDDLLSNETGYNFNLNAGITFLIMLGRNLYVETGIDFVNYYFSDSFSAVIKPRIGLGFRF